MTLRRKIIVCLLLVVTVIGVYSPVRHHDFVNYDDNSYITENQEIRLGWTASGVKWAFITKFHGHWHPLTWLSHMTDCQFFGLNPRWHHLSSLFIHLLNTILLFLVFARMTGALWSSAFMAALFALHPLHVETVAWISDRKDLLGTFFWILTIRLYARYGQRPGIIGYLLVFISFSLGLMSKSMVMTLPLVLLLLDFWPLNRWQKTGSGFAPGLKNSPDPESTGFRKLTVRLISEKAGLIVPVVFAGLMAVAAIRSEKLSSIDLSGLWTTKILFGSTLVSYVTYIGKMVWPFGLIIPYPYTGPSPLWQVIGAAVLIASITAVVFTQVRRRPYLTVGWLWYLITLLPVAGLIKAGPSAIADRYTYLPMIGLFMIIAWGVPDILPGGRFKKTVLSTAAIGLLAILTVLTWFQVGYWKNSITLFEHTLDVDPDNWLAHNNLGTALVQRGDYEKAAGHFSKAVEIRPYYSDALNNLGVVRVYQGRLNQAIQNFARAVRIRPDYAEAHYNLGAALMNRNDFRGAIRHFTRALELAPDYQEPFYALGDAYIRQGSYDQAFRHFAGTGRDRPDYAKANYHMGIVLTRQGKKFWAAWRFSQAIKIKPDYAEAHNNLGAVRFSEGRYDEALTSYLKAVELNPRYAEAHYNIGVLKAGQGDLEAAVERFTMAISIRPDYAQAHYNLGLILMKRNQLKKAAGHFSRALEIKPDHTQARRRLEALSRQLDSP